VNAWNFNSISPTPWYHMGLTWILSNINCEESRILWCVTITASATDVSRFNIILRGTAITDDYCPAVFWPFPCHGCWRWMRAGCIYLQAQQVRQFGERVVLQLPQFVPRQVPEIDSMTSSCSDVWGKWECPQLTRYIDNRILFYFLNVFVCNEGWKITAFRV